MPTKKSEQWYVDWIVEAGVCTDLPESLQSKDEVLLRLDNLLRQQDDELTGMHAADKRHFTAKKRGDSKVRYKKTTNLRRRVNTLSHPLAPPYGRHSDYYHSNIDLSNPPCEASSLPALSRVAIDAYDNETKLSLREQQVRNGPGNFRSSVRKLSPLGNFIKQHLVRSRSLTQLDSLSGSMLDTGEHHLEGDPSQQQPPHLHHHQQSHQLQHHPLGIECNRIRFLAPSATPTEIVNSNRRHKFSRSQVSSNEYFSVSFEVSDDVLTSFDREEFLPATRGTYLVDVLSPACERRGVDLSRVEVLDSSSTPLSLLTTDASTLGGKHLRVIVRWNTPAHLRLANIEHNQLFCIE
ncbi:Pleckstrin homology domain-containing family G member 5 [Trachymyrmex septentrionalis]|uniref:Pleckstrin homology domain-containing family G member 5 n=1 Tax=Trachymyrmex septentrionalis TaxID=34720 RepID=A0A195FTN7_9HYME|nr:Pleckstrin homology domain-containing family G member 5 [Trachymyrmex septentrionalis]